MSSTRSAAALILGGVLTGAAVTLHEIFTRRNDPGLQDLSTAILIVGAVLLILGTAVLQADLGSRLARIGFIVLAIGLVLGGQYGVGYTLAGLPFAVLGAALLGLAMALSRRVPPALGWLVALSIPGVAIAALAISQADELTPSWPMAIYGAWFGLAFSLVGLISAARR